MSGEEDEGDVPPASSEDKLDSVSSQSGSKSPWFRPGANPEALARLRPVPERRSIRMGGAGGGANSSAVDNAFKVWLASDANSGGNDDSSNDDSDEEYYVSNDWKKYIMIGNDYQARIPSTLLPLPSKKGNHGQLLWNPSQLDDSTVSSYLSSVSEVIHSREGLPGAPVERDNEDALCLLVNSQYDIDKALNKYREGAFDCKGMSPWTEEECRKFEIGLRTIGKDFFQLQKQVPTRTVKEVVEFYYLWKKTERYDIFSTQQSKNSKKYSLRPGYISDFMDDFLEPPDPDFPDLHYGTTTMAAEIKKDRSQHLLDSRLRDNLQKTVTAKSS
ncbi:PREDICTED: mesoderm induction early response protein 1 [Amphimedon queenslandica]|uniref:Mesoderm induction early response protein 1 n=1 Tax=Amphimedon queenslandica TaxID=400682 RepID=A0AAN0J835_AMPQE|nr:PREDICTED: mesoderm induction early response protein 1 [Amphimedon queenslandica]|eukprot:XP_019852891.1 PREDICTED: mesoderm induction early response protein 1 [Amphimedon queenslandica]